MCNGAPDDVISVSAFFFRFPWTCFNEAVASIACSWMDKSSVSWVMGGRWTRIVVVVGLQWLVVGYCWHVRPSATIVLRQQKGRLWWLECQHWTSKYGCLATTMSTEEESAVWQTGYSIFRCCAPLLRWLRVRKWESTSSPALRRPSTTSAFSVHIYPHHIQYTEVNCWSRLSAGLWCHHISCFRSWRPFAMVKDVVASAFPISRFWCSVLVVFLRELL